MNQNTSSPTRLKPSGPPAGLERLEAAIDQQLAADPNRLSDAALAEQVLALRRLAAKLAAVELRRLAAVDARRLT